MGLLDFLDPGKDDRERAAELAEDSIFQGGTATGAGGVTAGTSFDSEGRANISTGLGSFESLLQLLQGSGSNFLQPGGNAENADAFSMLQSVFSGSFGDLGAPDLDRSLSNKQDFSALGSQFQSDIAFAGQDPFALGASISDKFRPGLERAQGTLRNTTFDRLFSSGKASNSQAASPILEGLQTRFGEQNRELDFFGLQQGQGLIQSAFGRALAASNQREQIGGRNFRESFGSAQLLGQNALSRFGIGSGVFDSFLRNQQQQQTLGSAGIQNAAGLSQLPLSFLNAINAAGGLRGQTGLGAADINATNAANATSPFLEALNAAGQFASNIKPEGF